MNHHADHVFFQAQRGTSRFVEDIVYDLYLQEMVAGTQSSTLVGAAREGSLADGIGVGPLQAPVGLGIFDVALAGESAIDEGLWPFRQEQPQLFLVEVESPGSPDARGHAPKQLFDQLSQMRLDVSIEKVGTNQAHSAIDVVAHSARRNDAPFARIGGADTADAEAIAPMNVGHGQARVLNARQEGDVGYLLRRLVLLELFEQTLVSENQPVHAHAGLIAFRYSPAAFVHPFERSVIRVLWHGGVLARYRRSLRRASRHRVFPRATRGR